MLGLCAVPGGYAAFWLLTRVLAVFGAPAALWAHVAGAPVFALVALASPLFAPLLPLLLPVRARSSVHAVRARGGTDTLGSVSIFELC